MILNNMICELFVVKSESAFFIATNLRKGIYILCISISPPPPPPPLRLIFFPANKNKFLSLEP